MTNGGKEFNEMLALDKRAEIRLFLGEILILAALIGGSLCLILAGR